MMMGWPLLLLLSAVCAQPSPFTLEYSPTLAPLATGLDRLWDAVPMVDHNLEPNATSRFFLDVSSWTGGSLLGWAPLHNTTITCPLRQRTSTVRLLGGWGPATPPGPPGSVAWPDVVYLGSSGALQWRLPALWQRLDNLIVGARMDVVIVLDNVPYALARAGGAVSRYGQVLGPANDTAYGAFTSTLVEAMVARYGVDVVSRWQWRVGTEPNTRPGHWNDTVPAYLAMYDAVARALRAALPAAVLGPGNFCPFAPGVGCSDTAATIVLPIIDGLVAQGSPVSFLSSSHYGSYKRTSAPHDDPQAGYDPVWGARNALDLVTLQRRHPVLAHVPLSFQEFGTLANGPAGGIHNEPGAFGAAWRLATTAAAGVRGVVSFFDWGASGPDWALATDGSSAPPQLNHLVYSSSTLLRAFAWTARNATFASALVARGGASDTHCFSELEISPGVCVLPRSSGAPGAVQVAGLAAIAGSAIDNAPPLKPLAVSQLGPAAAGTLVVLGAVFSVHRNSTETANVSVAFSCPPQWGAAVCSGGNTPPALAVVLDASTCLYDVALAEAVVNGTNKTGALLVDGLADMVDAAGLRSMRDDAGRWMALQAASLQPRVAAAAGVALVCDAGRCTATAALAPPAVFALWVGPQ